MFPELIVGQKPSQTTKPSGNLFTDFETQRGNVKPRGVDSLFPPVSPKENSQRQYEQIEHGIKSAGMFVGGAYVNGVVVRPIARHTSDSLMHNLFAFEVRSPGGKGSRIPRLGSTTVPFYMAPEPIGVIPPEWYGINPSWVRAPLQDLVGKENSDAVLGITGGKSSPFRDEMYLKSVKHDEAKALYDAFVKMTPERLDEAYHYLRTQGAIDDIYTPIGNLNVFDRLAIVELVASQRGIALSDLTLPESASAGYIPSASESVSSKPAWYQGQKADDMFYAFGFEDAPKAKVGNALDSLGLAIPRSVPPQKPF